MIDLLNRGQTGIYKCQAENVHGKAESELTIDVLFRPSCFVSHATNALLASKSSSELAVRLAIIEQTHAYGVDVLANWSMFAPS